MEWRLEALDLGLVVAQAVRANRSLFENRGIALTLEASDAKAPVLADQDKIVQVLPICSRTRPSSRRPGGKPG